MCSLKLNGGSLEKYPLNHAHECSFNVLPLVKKTNFVLEKNCRLSKEQVLSLSQGEKNLLVFLGII